MTDDLTTQVVRIFDHAKHEALALIVSLPSLQPAAPPPLPEWMTDTELARYWHIFDKDGEPSTAGIISWTNRPPDEEPLPCARMGEMRRFHRETADHWAWEESERQKAKQAKKRLREVKRA